MCPFKAGMFLNFRLQIVHSTGLSGNCCLLLSPKLALGLDELDALVPVLLALLLAATLPLVFKGVAGVVVDVFLLDSCLLLLCLKSCSMSCNCCAVSPLLENLILVSPKTLDLEMR